MFPLAIRCVILAVAAAGEPSAPFICATPATGAIKLDGRLDEPAWQQAVTGSDMRVLGENTAALRATTFRALTTDDALYLGIHCEAPAGRAMPKPKATDRDGPAFGDEAFELYFQPATPGPYYHLVANVTAVRYDGIGMDGSWNGEWEVRTSTVQDGWQAEVRVPFRTLGLSGKPKPGDTWRFNIARNDQVNRQYQTWAGLSAGFHEPESFGTLRFTDGPVGVGAVKLERRGRDLVLKTDAQAAATALKVEVEAALRTPAGQFQLRPSQAVPAGKVASLAATAERAWDGRAGVWLSYAVRANDQALYQPAALTIPAKLIRPVRSGEPTAITVANSEVALTFDQATGRLLAASNKLSGLDARFGDAGTPILELDTVRYISNPRFFRNEDVLTLVPDFDTLASVSKRRGDEGESLLIQHRLDPDIRVSLTITVPKQGAETEWRIELDNRLVYQPTQALVVHRVRYPMLSDVPEAACGDQPHVITPWLMGQKFAEPGKTLATHRPMPYIGPCTMGWIDFYGSKGGLYFKVGDVDPLPQTDLIAQSDAKTRQLRLGIQRWSLCWPGQKWTPGPCGLAAHAGDWHAAADLYRAWFRRTFKQHPRPQWLADSDGYVMSGGPTYEFADFPRAIANAQATGLGYMQLWSEMTGGDISYHAFAFPNPYMGTEDELKASIAALHQRGGRVGVYLNFNTGDPLLGTFVRQPSLAQKIPDRIPRPALDYMKDNWIQQSIMGHAGGYSTWNTIVPGYLDGYWNACPAGDKWTDFYYYWVIEKWAKEYKLDVWYLDSCPVARGSPCFAFDHGHKDPMPEGQAIIGFYKRLRAGAPDGFCIMQEYSSDRLLPYSTHALGLIWHPPHAFPEVVRYTLPEYPLFSGMCNGTRGLQQFYPEDKGLTFEDALERVFLIGNRYEFPISTRPPELASDWRRKMVALRQACKPEMNYGDFLDDLGLGPMPPRTYARLFRRADRGRLAVTLLDRRKGERAPLEVRVDLKVAGVGPARNAALMTLDGPKALPAPKRDGATVSLTVPPYEGRVAALLIETESRE